MTLRALLRSDPIPVRVGPLQVVLPAGWADAWLVALEDGDLTSVIPGMLDDADRFEVTSALVTGTLTDTEVAQAARGAIEEAAGRPWHEVVKLAAYSARASGEITAALVLEGVHPSRVTIGMWCAAVVAYMTPRLDEMNSMRFQADLKMPPGGSARDVQGFDSVQMK